MDFDLISLVSGPIEKQAIDQVVGCNEYTRQYGLVLTRAQAIQLVETRSLALRDTGRIEFGEGVISKIIKAFCDSPYISTYNYVSTIQELTELFYYYKNETMDLLSDDELIAYMQSAFDGCCQGSLQLLAGRELERLARNLRFGLPLEESGDDLPEDEEDQDES